MGPIFVLLETPEGAFRAQGVHRMYDYFIVHPTLGPYIEGVRVLEEYPSTPHKPVAITLQVQAKHYVKRVQRKPRNLPAEPICGPVELGQWPSLETRAETQGELGDYWKQVVASMENEVLRSHGIDDDRIPNG